LAAHPSRVWKILDFRGVTGMTARASVPWPAAKTGNNPMLDAMRRGVANILAKILLGLLVIAFAVWGIGDYIVRRPAQSGTLATVGKTQITVAEFKQAYQDEVQEIGRKLGGKLTSEQAQQLGIPPRALARLIGLAAIDLHANNLGITVSTDLIRQSIKGNPAFQGADGQFSDRQFRQTYVQQGFRSEPQYVQALRQELLRHQLTDTVGAGATPQQFLVDALYRFRDETRVIESVTTDFGKLIKIAEPDESKLKEFYEKNKRQYIALEERKINLLLLARDAVLSRVSVTDDEVKAAYEAAKDSYDVAEKRRIQQLPFADKAAAEKAYAELSKAKDFDEAATKLGFPPSEIQLGAGPLTRAEMIDPKIAEAAFKLKKNELSRPVEGLSVVLLRVPEIEPGKKRTFEEVKGEIRDRIAGERFGQQLQALQEQIEAARGKGTPLKEIAEKLKIPFQEIAAINRTGKTAEGKAMIAHADAAKLIEAFFGATPGVETEVLELSDGGYGWFDLVGVTPERQRPFAEVEKEVRTNFVDAERRKEMASLAAKQIERLKGGETMDAIAKTLGAKVERTPPIKRSASPPPPGLSAFALQQAFALPKGGTASAPTADGKSYTVFRVADIIAAPEATAERTADLKADLAKQLRIDLLEQYVAGLRTRYGFTVNEKALLQTLGVKGQADQDGDN
jgi:peptidyl-prolyl cis-trans isomerase D